jgi:hypothetical protein
LTDEADSPLADLSEGDEVTVLAWRPAWAGTTRYCVRVTESGLEGWLPAAALRSTKTAISSVPTPPPSATARPETARAANVASRGRRFGERLS